MALYPDLKDKVVLITGAASGIGRAAVEAFARAEANLVLADVNQAQGEALAKELVESGRKAVFVRVDVSKRADCEELIGVTRETFGRLDAAFNNAGVNDNGDPPASEDVPQANWERIVDIDLSGVFYCIQAELPLLLESGGGAIVNTASLQSFISFPKTAAYTAAKHGVLGVTRAIATEYGPRGIRCNAVAPGIVATPMTKPILDAPEWHDALVQRIPLRRVAQPVDIARAVLWMCSSDAAYVNGICLPVDGGYLA